MYMTRKNLNGFYHQVHQNAAKKLDIEDFESKSTSELEKELQNNNPQVASRVKVFIEAYESWVKVHVNIETAGSAGKLSTEVYAALMKAISDLDSTRKALIDELANSNTSL